MIYIEKYRQVRDVREEGFGFYLILQYIVYFYTQTMKGQIKQETPDVLMHYCRDWEYPWVLLKSEIKPNNKVLDCGSGFSPLPFIWSKLGGEVCAVDKDVIICSPFVYFFTVFFRMINGIIKAPLVVLKKIRQKEFSSLYSYLKPTNILVRNWHHIRKTWRPDTWGPVSPKLLRKYKVNYQKGDLTNLPYKDGYFDIVSCVSVLEHMSFEDQIRGMREMSRVVRKGGKLIITYDKKEDLTDLFIKESGMTPTEIVNFTRPNNPYNRPDVIGICLVK